MQFKKPISLFTSLALLINALALPLNAFAQTETPTEEPTPSSTITPTPDMGVYEGGYEKAYKDYVSQLEVYRDAHSDYIVRRSQYLRFKTLQSQQDAQDATVIMLKERDGVVISYFLALKERLREEGSSDNPFIGDLNVMIDDQIGWFKDHRDKVPSAGSLNDLIDDSDEAQEQFENAELLIDQILGTISSGRLTDMRERLDDKFTELKEKLDKIRNEDREDYQLSSQKIQKLDRWVFDSEQRLQRFEEKQAEADSVIDGLAGLRQSRNVGSFYADAIQKLIEAQQYLRESSSFMLEILHEIKTAEEE